MDVTHAEWFRMTSTDLISDAQARKWQPQLKSSEVYTISLL